MQRDYRHVFCEPSTDDLAHLLCVRSAGIYECDKSFYEDSFYHDGYYYICVIRGRGYVGIDGVLSPVGAGQFALLDLQKPYRFYPDPSDPWTFGWLHFDGCGADWFYHKICDRSNLFSASAETAAQDLDALLACHERRAVDCEMRASALIHKLLGDLYAVSRDFRSVYLSPKEYPDAIQQVVRYIEINYFRKLTLEELARTVYLSPYHLLRVFKKHTGFTPLEYTNQYRFSLAKQMLGGSDLTIEKIALNTGFCSHSYFSKSFREAVGMTPEEFRRMYRRKTDPESV